MKNKILNYIIVIVSAALASFPIARIVHGLLSIFWWFLSTIFKDYNQVFKYSYWITYMVCVWQFALFLNKFFYTKRPIIKAFSLIISLVIFIIFYEVDMKYKSDYPLETREDILQAEKREYNKKMPAVKNNITRAEYLFLKTEFEKNMNGLLDSLAKGEPSEEYVGNLFRCNASEFKTIKLILLDTLFLNASRDRVVLTYINKKSNEEFYGLGLIGYKDKQYFKLFPFNSFVGPSSKSYSECVIFTRNLYLFSEKTYDRKPLNDRSFWENNYFQEYLKDRDDFVLLKVYSGVTNN